MRFLILMLALLAAPAHACGVDTDCRIGERTYRIYMPKTLSPPKATLLYLHGYRGSAKAAMRNQAMRRLADDMNVALVAAKSASFDWLIPGVPENPAETGDKEFTYFDALLGQLESRHLLDPSKVVVAGFSAGGMMVWNLACHRGSSFAGFIPVAGTFWDPVPESCPSGPVNMVHIHGLKDKIVPLGGRPIQQTKQGDVPTALERAVKAGKFDDAVEIEGRPAGLKCERRENPGGKILVFCTHNGGHSLKMSYIRAAWSMFSDIGAIPR